MPRKPEDLTGQRFGRLVVVKRVGTDKQRAAIWLCKCDCGDYKTARAYALKRGNVRSCGCISKERAYLKGLREHPVYNAWVLMKGRCYNKNRPDYQYYGAKGITVCDEWRDNPLAFMEWAFANGWKEGLSIDRIDPYGNYEPSNCRWTTREVQSANRRVRDGKKGIGIRKLPSGHYWVQIKHKGKRVFGKTFNTLEEAIKARNDFIIENGLPHTVVTY